MSSAGGVWESINYNIKACVCALCEALTGVKGGVIFLCLAGCLGVMCSPQPDHAIFTFPLFSIIKHFSSGFIIPVQFQAQRIVVS